MLVVLFIHDESHLLPRVVLLVECHVKGIFGHRVLCFFVLFYINLKNIFHLHNFSPGGF